jgi:hypothetical protein
VLAGLVAYVSCLVMYNGTRGFETLDASMTLSIHYADRQLVETITTITSDSTADTNDIKALSRAVVTAETNTTNDHADTQAVDTTATATTATNDIKTLSRSVVTTGTNSTNDHGDEESRHFLTHNSTVLPSWFKEYSILHRTQRSALNETNSKFQRFLIMRCLDFDEKCGGASDRLQSVPAMLMLANKTGRMLFIKWSRPAPLQEFLVPPTGGFDWTIPEWLDQLFDFGNFPLRRL